MKNRLLVGLLVLGGLGGLVGCRKPEASVITQTVEVPVAVPCPEPPAVPRPTPICSTLPADATNQVKARALVLDLTAWIAYSLELEKILNGYRQPAKPKEPAK